MVGVNSLVVLADGTSAGVHPAIPLLILALGMSIVIGMIVVLRVNAFLALIAAATVVSLLAPGAPGEKISRVATAFGETAGKIGVVIALAAVIGKCLIDSGAADRIVRAFVRLLGRQRCAISLMSSGFVLSIPVFFDTVFYLLLPLARSMHRHTGRSYLFLILAMGAGASITHSLVPPTPGPLLIADTLGIDLGMMIVMGLVVAIPTAVVVYFFIGWLSRRVDIPMRPLEGMKAEPEPLPDEQLPGLAFSLLPILLPVLLISTHTVVTTLNKNTQPAPAVTPADVGAATARTIPILQRVEGVTSVVGNANLAMMLSAAVALYLLCCMRRPSRKELAAGVESSLMSAGVIILITSAGGAFGAMLKEARIGEAIQTLMVGGGGTSLGGISLLVMAFFVATLLKFAQGSTTVSMITTSAMLAALLPPDAKLGYHPVYLACAIGFGAQCLNWMNDSGFWIFAKMGGLTETETLRTWTVTVSTMAVVGLGFTILLARFMPLT